MASRVRRSLERKAQRAAGDAAAVNRLRQQLAAMSDDELAQFTAGFFADHPEQLAEIDHPAIHRIRALSDEQLRAELDATRPPIPRPALLGQPDPVLDAERKATERDRPSPATAHARQSGERAEQRADQ